ncbi:mRNA surveillance protein pelota [Candidatus Woesearchaeota archaeon]|nr:mRNA surveillance protein pelota [Candidatus Woesearchaeota archaeon]|tara:strand:- start:5199 stop:6263 length:1065 start_codon:yes stop_codon:yes gene_type:complete
MDIIKQNAKKGLVTVKIKTMDDLWYLSQVIEPEDIVRGKTIRKIKLGKEGERAQKVAKKHVFISIKAEKLEFHKYSDILRVSGIIIEGPEDVQKGSYHTFNIEENSVITVIKEHWLKFQLDRLKEAKEQRKEDILICVFDREEADFGLLKKQGYKLLSHLKGDVSKKVEGVNVKNTFYSDIIRKIEEYDKRYKIRHILLASPAFWKEELMKTAKNEELKKKIVLATCSNTGSSGVNEVLKRDEIRNILKKERIAKEMGLVEELFKEISKDNLAAYGLKEVKGAVNAGAVTKLLVTDSLIQKSRQENRFSEIEELMKLTEQMKAEIFIISGDNEAGKKLEGLGGIGAVLRFKLNY